MEFKYTESIVKLPFGCYIITVNTMEGDADDYHSFNLTFREDQIEELKERIIQCEVLSLAYPNGRGCYDGYDELDFFEKNFSDGWYCYEGCWDSFDGYSVVYYDENSKKFNVNVSLSKEDEAKINSYPVLNF